MLYNKNLSNSFFFLVVLSFMNGVGKIPITCLICTLVFSIDFFFRKTYFDFCLLKKMTNNFQIGSLTELVERSGMKMMKKKKPIDKMKSSSPVMKKIMKMKKSTKMQTKKSIILNKKKKTLKKLTTIIEPAKDSDDNDDDDVDQEMNVGDNQTIPESNDDDNSEKQDSEKQMRTLFIGNLPANFPMKVS